MANRSKGSTGLALAGALAGVQKLKKDEKKETPKTSSSGSSGKSGSTVSKPKSSTAPKRTNSNKQKNGGGSLNLSKTGAAAGVNTSKSANMSGSSGSNSKNSSSSSSSSKSSSSNSGSSKSGAGSKSKGGSKSKSSSTSNKGSATSTAKTGVTVGSMAALAKSGKALNSSAGATVQVKPPASLLQYQEDLLHRGIPTSARVQRDTGIRKPDNAMERVVLAGLGGAKQSVGSFGAGLGVIPALSDKWRSDAGMRSSSDIAAELEEEYKTATGLRKIQLAQDIKRFREQGYAEGGGRRLIDKGGELSNSGSRDIMSAKNGLGSLGKLAVDVGVGIEQMGIDTATGFAMGMGGNNLVPMFIRTLGASTNEALSEGASLERAAAYGTASAAVEVGTEKLFSFAKPLKKMVGKGIGDEALEKLVGRATFDFIKSKEGRDLAQAVMRTGLAATSEGAEEVISSVVNPLLKNITYTDGEKIDLKEALYEGLVGGIIGGIFGSGSEINTYRDGSKLINVNDNGIIFDELIYNGKNSANETTRRLASEIGNDYRNGDEITNYQLGRLHRAVSEDIKSKAIDVSQRDFSVETLTNRLIEARTEESTAKAAARALSSVFSGKDVSNTMAEAIINTPQAVNIYNEMSARGIPDGTMAEKRNAIKGYAQMRSKLTYNERNTGSEQDINEIGKIAENGIRRSAERGGASFVNAAIPERMTMARETPVTEAVRNEIRNYGDNGAKAFSSAFTAANSYGQFTSDISQDGNSQNMGRFSNWAKAFSSYYRAGLAGLPFDRVRRTNGVYDEYITSEAAVKAFLAGENDRTASLEKRKSNLTGEIAEAGRVVDRSHVSVSKKVRNVLERLAEKTGTKIVIESTLEANGYYENGEIHIGADAMNPLTVVARHEITHNLREISPELYNAFEEYLMNEMTQEEMIDAIEAKKAAYKKSRVELSDEAVIEEIVAEYTENLFTDEDAFAKLVGADRTLAEKLLDLLKDFITKIRGMVSSADIRVLTDAQKMWINMLNGAQSVERSSTEIRQSIKYDADNKPFVVIDEDILDGVAKEDWAKAVRDNLKNRYPSGMDIKGKHIKVDAQSRKEMTYSEYTKYIRDRNPEMYADKMRATNNLDELIVTASDWVNEGIKHLRKDDIVDFARADVRMCINNNDYTAKILIAGTKNGKMKAYDIINLKPTQIKKQATSTSSKITNRRTELSVPTNSISNEDEKSNKKFSLKYDADNRPFVEIDDDILVGVKKDDWANVVRNNLKNKYPNGIEVRGKHIRINREMRKELTRSQYTGLIKRTEPNMYADKLRATNNLDELIISASDWINEDLNHLRKDDIIDFARAKVRMRVGENDYIADILVAGTEDRQMKLYDIVNLEKTIINEKMSLSSAGTSVKKTDRQGKELINNSISNSNEKSNRKFSLKYDDNGNPISFVDKDIFEGKEGKKHQIIADYIAEHVGEAYTLIESGQKVYIGKELPNEFTHSKYTQRLIHKRGILNVKNQMVQNIGEIVEISKNRRWKKNYKEKHAIDAKYGFYTYTSKIAIKTGEEKADTYVVNLIIRNDADGKKYLYDIQGIKRTGTMPLASTHNEPAMGDQKVAASKPAFNNSISNSNEKSNRKFSLKEPVEEKGSLVALHNITTSNMLKILKLGAFPMPSIAVTKADIPHTRFGEITLVMNKSAIDPETDSRNAVYSADAWTPRFPRIKYKANERTVDKLIDMYYDISDALDEDASEFLYRFAKYTDTMLTAFKGEENLIRILKKSEDMKNIFLADTSNKSVNQEEYENWLYDVFSGIEEKKGIYNNKSYFTSDFSERSFDELHDPVTLENIVRVMAAQNEGNSRNVVGFSGVKGLRAEMTKRFESIKDIHDSEGRLRDLTAEEADKINRNLEKRLKIIKSDIIKKTGRENDSFEREKIGDLLLKVLKEPKVTVDSIVRVFGNRDYMIGNKIAIDIRNLLFDINEMPVHIFEAKPERIVMFDEILAAIVPDDASRELTDGLESAGVDVITYEAGNNDSRLEMVNSVPNAKFSLREYSEEEKINWSESKKIILYENDSQFRRFVYDVLAGSNKCSGKKVYFGAVTEKMAEKILSFTGIDVENYNVSLSDYEIRKIFGDHGDDVIESLRGQRAVTVDDLSSIPEIIEYADSISLSPNKYAGCPVIMFKSNTNGKVEVAAKVSKKHLDLSVQTMYAGRKKGSLAPPLDEQASNNTPEASRGTASDNSIYETDEKNNKKFSLKVESFKEDKYFSRMMDEWDFLDDGKRVKVGNIQAGSALNRVGLPPAAMYFDVGKIKKAMTDHSDHLTIGKLKEIPDLLNDPIVIAEYKGKDGKIKNTVNVYGNLFIDNAPIVVGIVMNLDRSGSNIITNVRTIHARSNFIKQVNDNTVLYLNENKKKTRQWFQVCDNLNVPLEGTKFGLIRSISFDNENGNRKYSLKEKNEEEMSYKRLARENDILRESLEKARRELRHSDRTEVDISKVEQYAKDVVREYNASIESAYVTEELFSIYNDMGGSDTDYIDVKERATLLAEDIISSSEVLNTEMQDNYIDLINTIKNTPIMLAEEDRKELAYYEDSYNDFRRANIGKIRLANGAKLSVDEFYAGLCEEYPEMFDASIENPAEQLTMIRDVIDRLRPVYENPYGEFYDEAVEMLSLDIIEAFFDIPQARKTFADRAEDKLERQKIKDSFKLRELRERKDEQIVKIKEESKKRKQEALRKVRVDRDKKIREVKDYYINMNKERKSKAGRRVRINQIKVITMDMVKKLEKPTDNKHIPETLRRSVAMFFSSIDFEMGRQGRWMKETLMNLRLELKDIADGIRDGESSFFVNIDADLDNILKSLVESTGGGVIADMTDSEVEELYRACRAVKFIVSTANRRFAEGRNESISDTSEALISDLKAKKDKKDRKNAAVAVLDRHFNMNTVNPLDFFDELGTTGKQIYKDLRRAMNKKTESLASCIDKMQKLTEGTGAAKWGKHKKTFDMSGGRRIELTDTQVMSLYLLNKREQARVHIYDGGIKLHNTSSAPVSVTTGDVEMITAFMSEAQKKVADGISEILNTDSTDLINEASMQVFGYAKARERNYFPIESDNDFIVSAIGAVPGDPSIKNKGQFKATLKGANNPIVLDDIFDVFAKTMDNVTTYNAYLGVFSDLQRIFNYRSESGAVKQLITQKFGKGANEYIQNLIVDLNGGMSGRSMTPITDNLLRNYKAAMIGWNISVMLQQPTAVTRAYAMIDAKYIAKGIAKKGDYDRVKKYSSIAKWKDWGFFTNNTGREFKSLCLNKSKLTDKFFEPIGAMDNIAWGKLWNAVEYEMRDMRPELAAGSEEFYAAVSERFEDIIDRTQVVDSTLHRSNIMRSDDKLARVYTSFMSEPLKNYNLVRSSVIAAIEEGTPEARNRAARAVTGFVMSNLTATFMASLVTTLRNKEKDDDRGWLELFACTFRGRFIENTFAAEPLSNTIIQILDGRGTDRMELAGIADFCAAVMRFNKNLAAMVKGEEEPFTWAKVNKDIIAAAGKCTGVPTATLIRDFEAFLDTTFDMTDWYEGQYAKVKMFNNIGLSENRSKFMRIFYQALLNGDKKAATMIYNDMLVNGIPRSYIESRYKEMMREDLLDETEDMRNLIDEWNSLSAQERTRELRREYEERLGDMYLAIKAMGYSDSDINSALEKNKSASVKSEKFMLGKAYEAYKVYREDPNAVNKEAFLLWYYPLLDAGYDEEDILEAFAAMEE